MATITVSTQQSTAVVGDYLLVRLYSSEPLTGLAYSEIQVSGDLGYLSSEFQTLFGAGTTQHSFYARIPSSLGANGGAIRVRLSRTAVSPNLNADLDVTIRWNAAGTIEILNTADIVYPELNITLNLDYVAIGGTITATFTFSEVGTQTITEFVAGDVSVTDGITKGALVKVSNTVYTMQLTAPSSGNGQGVVSVAADRVFPSNTAASATFLYIDAINAEISLSTAYVENDDVVIAQFDFDYDVPNFQSSFVSVDNANASVGTARALDDRNRCWVVPVRAPETGQGELEISLPEDAIGFAQAAVMAPVQFAPVQTLAIGSFTTPLQPIIGQPYNSPAIHIMGDLSYVDIVGEFRPFSAHWIPTTNNLHIRGRPESYYEDLDFQIIARDKNGNEVRASGTINVVDLAPVIHAPSEPIEIALGLENSLLIPVENRPAEGMITGSWIGMTYEVTADGFVLSGEPPAQGFGPNQANPYVNAGELVLNAKNTGGPAMEATADWKFSTPRAPVWDRTKLIIPGKRQIGFEIGDEIDIDLAALVTGVPNPVITYFEDSNQELPDWLEVTETTHRLRGTAEGPADTTYDFQFQAENEQGLVTVTIQIVIFAAGAIVNPSYIADSLPTLGFYRVGLGSSNFSLTTLFTGAANPWIRGITEFYELIGLNDDRLYQHKTRHDVNAPHVFVFNSDREWLEWNRVRNNNVIIDVGEWVQTHVGTHYSGTDRTVQIRKTTSRGTAITPEFTLRLRT